MVTSQEAVLGGEEGSGEEKGEYKETVNNAKEWREGGGGDTKRSNKKERGILGEKR